MEQGFKVVGKSIPVIDAVDKVTSKAKFTADVKLPGMLYAKVLGSPYPHATVKSIDVSGAKALPAVKAVITCKDEEAKHSFHPHSTRPLEVLTEHPLCVGDEIAAVAAESVEAAKEAISKIKAEYEVLPAVFDAVEALEPEAPKIYPEGNLADEEGQPIVDEWGDIEEGFKEADVVVEDTFKTSMVVHAAMEPRACVAHWDGESLTAYVSTQYPHRVAEDIATVLQIPVSHVRVITKFVGGGFGGKYQERYTLIAALLSVKAGRPVKLEYSRQEEFTIGRRRYAVLEKVKIGARRDGLLNALHMDSWYNVGAYGTAIGGSLYHTQSRLYLLKCPNGLMRSWDVSTNLLTAQPMRGVQIIGYNFAIDQVLDEIAEKLNLSPAQVRLENSYKPGETMQPYGATLSTYSLEDCIKRALAIIDWDKKWKGFKQPVKVDGAKRVGLGLSASMGWSMFERELTSAIVKLETDGSATLITGAQDTGTSNKTALCQIVAEILDLPMDKVAIITADTRVTPKDAGTYSSRTIYCAGEAARRAAEEAKKKLFAAVAFLLEAKPEELAMKEGVVFVEKEPERSIPIAEALNPYVSPIPIIGLGILEPTEYIAPFREKVYVGAAMAHAAEVEVDVETGEVKLLNYAAVHDVGRAINPALVKNQMYGGVIMGLGYALTEELVFDPTTNAYLNPDFLDYKLPTIRDIPPIHLELIEPEEPTGPLGAKGVAEHAICCVPGATANAIYNAVGVRVKDLPIKPEKILRELGTL